MACLQASDWAMWSPNFPFTLSGALGFDPSFSSQTKKVAGVSGNKATKLGETQEKYEEVKTFSICWFPWGKTEATMTIRMCR